MARGPRSRRVQQMRPRRVYCIAVSGGFWRRSLTVRAGGGVRDVVRRRWVVVFAAGAVALLGAGCAQATPATTTPPSTTPVSTAAVVPVAAGSWGRAIAVPGLAALDGGRHGRIMSVSCRSAGNCSAGGIYFDRHGHPQGFVAVEANGVWGRAIEVP